MLIRLKILLSITRPTGIAPLERNTAKPTTVFNKERTGKKKIDLLIYSLKAMKMRYLQNYKDKGFESIKEADLALISKYAPRWIDDSKEKVLLGGIKRNPLHNKSTSRTNSTSANINLLTQRSSSKSKNESKFTTRSNDNASLAYYPSSKRVDNIFRVRRYYLAYPQTEEPSNKEKLEGSNSKEKSSGQHSQYLPQGLSVGQGPSASTVWGDAMLSISTADFK
jgi:hypothetical protein